MPDVSASFCITKDLEVTFFTLNFSPNKLKIHGGRNSMESCGWGVITTWDAFEESWSVPSLAKAAISADLSPVFFLLHRMNVSSFSILTVWQKKLLISIFHTNIHVCVYIYIYFTQYKFHISKWSFRRWICLFQVCKATRNPSPLPWGSPSWPRGNGPGAVSGTQQFPVVFLLTSHGKTFRLFFFPGKKKDQHFLDFFLGFVTFGLGGGEGGGLGCWLNFRIVV